MAINMRQEFLIVLHRPRPLRQWISLGTFVVSFNNSDLYVTTQTSLYKLSLS
jgi:hypothetical protein